MQIDQRLLLELSEEGSYFVYDLDGLRAHAQRLVGGAAQVFYASKANPLSALLSTLKEVGLRFDAASEGELFQLEKIGVSGASISLTGPAKSEALLRQALEQKVGVFVIESPGQLNLLERLVPDYDYEPELLFRLQIEGLGEAESALGGEVPTAFGMDMKTARELMPQLRLPFLGFHVFQWSQILDLNELTRVWRAAIEACLEIRSDLRLIDLGGGLGIPYEGERPLDWDQVTECLLSLKKSYALEEIYMELGRYIVGPYGYYISRVLDRKQTHGRDILILEGGIHHLLRPALVHVSFPVSLLRSSRADVQSFSIHGPLCTSLDSLGVHELPSDVSPGDTLLISQVGAYGFTESMPLFLCHKWAGEAVVEDNSIRICRRPQPASSWLQ